MSYEHLIADVNDGVLTVTVNRPEFLNAMNAHTIGELDAVFADAAANDDVKALIITGAGEKSFVAGADIAELVDHTPQSGAATALRGQKAFRRLETMGKPSVAAINGFALGGGCELAMACTIRIGAQGIKIGLPEVGLGVIPGYGGTQRLPRLVGRGVAMELILSGSAVDADEARRIGLLNQVVPGDELMKTAEKLVRRILRNGPLAIRSAMEAVDHGLDVGFEDGCKIEASLFGLLCSTEDKKEGLSAFLEKRRPQFKGK